MLRLFFFILLFTFLSFAEPLRAQEAPRRHWSFQPLRTPAVPKVQLADRVRTPIDAFILDKLQTKKLDLSPDADPLTLIRRVHFDLLGLPPSPEDVAAFEKSAIHNPQSAIENLLDRLLASPRFGERWGRHWLDNAGYADVTGTDNDAGIIRTHENRWRYRDWVIAAFNADLPFDRFLTMQLAGDELFDCGAADKLTREMIDALVATGFLRTAADDTEENELNTMDIRYGVLHRTMETAASNLLALTLNCAKCHDHKYERISQRDYYQLQALFQPAFNPHNWLQPKSRQLAEIAPVQKAEFERHNAEIQKKLDEVKKQQALKDPSEDGKKRAADLEKQAADLNRQLKKWEHLQAVYDAGPPTATHILKRGNPNQPGKEAPPGFLTALSSPSSTALLEKTQAAGKTSGRRLALARWLNEPGTPANALVLRVRVNRIWQQLFGVGLVPTSDNFGESGANPSHPELLDWLAVQYQADGLRLKPFLKRMMLSSVYRQASARDEEDRSGVLAHKADPDNRLLWRLRLRRLEAEAIRDTILAVSGKLDATSGGPPVAVQSKPDGSFAVSAQGQPTPTSQYRRSVYLLSRRNYHPTFLNVFDQPNLSTNCTARATSAVVSQTLTMLNDPFVLEQANFLAERVQKAAGDETARIETAMKLVLGRPPREGERKLAQEFLQRQVEQHTAMKQPAEEARRRALVNLCHMLLNTSEFLYVH